MDTLHPDAEATVAVAEGVHLTQLVVGDRMSVQHVRMEPGAEVPIHSHHHEQLGFVSLGTLTFRFEDGGEVPVEPGGSYVLEGDEPHGAVNDGDETVLAVDVFSPPRPNPDWQDD